jgi:hypothetical protein
MEEELKVRGAKKMVFELRTKSGLTYPFSNFMSMPKHKIIFMEVLEANLKSSV